MQVALLCWTCCRHLILWRLKLPRSAGNPKFLMRGPTPQEKVSLWTFLPCPYFLSTPHISFALFFTILNNAGPMAKPMQWPVQWTILHYTKKAISCIKLTKRWYTFAHYRNRVFFKHTSQWGPLIINILLSSLGPSLGVIIWHRPCHIGVGDVHFLLTMQCFSRCDVFQFLSMRFVGDF